MHCPVGDADESSYGGPLDEMTQIALIIFLGL